MAIFDAQLDAGIAEADADALAAAAEDERAEVEREQSEWRRHVARETPWLTGEAAAARPKDVPQDGPQDAVINPWAHSEFPSPPSNAVYQGLMGEIANALMPYTEADPLTLLTTGLTMAGTCMGAAVSVMGHAARPNLFVVHVGRTGTGRKGTGLHVMREAFRALYSTVTDLWAPPLQSGEGLAGHLERKAPEERTLIVEPEFGRLLTIMGRQGSTLSMELRRAFDYEPLGHTRSREEAMITNHHIALIGQVTPEELAAKLQTVDLANGFANRLLFVAVERRHVVTNPGDAYAIAQPFGNRLRDAIVEAAGPYATVRMDAQSQARWEQFRTDEESRRRLGLAGALTARTTMHALRLALVYALLDRAREIRLPHLEAAIALSDYARASVLWAFGDSTGNPHSDVLREWLRTDGEIEWQEAKSRLGLRTAADMDACARVIVEAGIADVVLRKRPGGGRPTRLLRAVETTT